MMVFVDGIRDEEKLGHALSLFKLIRGRKSEISRGKSSKILRVDLI
jgi:hypothetical protein